MIDEKSLDYEQKKFKFIICSMYKSSTWTNYISVINRKWDIDETRSKI